MADYNIQTVDNIQPVQNPYEDRITAILNQRSQPPPQMVSPEEFNSYAAGNIASGQGPQTFLNAIQALTQNRQEAYNTNQDRQLQNAQGLYNLFETKRANGDKQAQALFDKIKLFTGGDPAGTAMFLDQLHQDPESIDPGNSFQVMTKLAGIAKKSGYTSPESQKTSLELQKTKAEIGKLNREASGAGSSGKVWGDAQKLVEASQNTEHPLDLLSAYSIAKSGVGQGSTFDPSTGQITPMQGAPQAAGAMKFGAESGRQQAKLDFAGPIASASKTGELDAQRQFDQPKVQSSLVAHDAATQNVMSKIDETIPQVGSMTAGIGSITNAIPGTPAADLKANLETIGANLGFQRLEEMRQNSPNGSALARATQMEILMLQQTMNNIAQSQSPTQLSLHLNELKTQVASQSQRLKDAYDLTYPNGNQTPSAPSGRVVHFNDLPK